MDHIDRKILDLLQTEARAPLKEIADKVFLSSPAVSARMDRLERSGILTGYQAQINAAGLGYLVKAFINLDMDPSQKPEFYPYIQSCPHVVECNCVTGDYSMLIEVLFRTTQELDQFINHLQKFGRTRTQIVFSTSVEHRGIPLSEDSEDADTPSPEK
jgi:Lrp/AsnC family leucine-responsive transcriptional regulator